uniref:Putative ovule protein n=1 Tax=Solanum chacoense TaxID=4108 RepID=A0A0V0HKJ1_SOLCH
MPLALLVLISSLDASYDDHLDLLAFNPIFLSILEVVIISFMLAYKSLLSYVLLPWILLLLLVDIFILQHGTHFRSIQIVLYKILKIGTLLDVWL